MYFFDAFPAGAWSRRAGIVAALVASSAAWAGPFDDIEARRAIVELRKRVEATDAAQTRLLGELQRSREDSARFQGQALDLESQLSAVRAELAKVKAQNDQAVREFAEAQRLQREAVQVTDERLKKLEPVRVAVDGREFLAEPAERREYESAFAAFRQNDFAGAQQGFGDLVRRYPQSGYAPSALFWQGNALYALQRCKEAIGTLRVMLTQAPDHPRTPDAKLSIGNCEIDLNEPASAKKTLEDLTRSHPRTEAASAARERLRTLVVAQSKG